MEENRKQCCSWGWWRKVLLDNLLVILTLLAVIIGFLVGFGVRTLDPSQDAIIWIGLPGEVYMRMLKMMVLPLIICSVITGTASLDSKCNGKISAVALTYIIVTNSIPCIIAITMAFAIRPGRGVEMIAATNNMPSQVMETPDIFADLIRNLFPDNIVTACFLQAQTKYSSQETQHVTNSSGQLINISHTYKVKAVGTAPSTNILGLVICCTVFGKAITTVGKAGQPFLQFFRSANEVIMRVLRWFVWVTPIGVASLITKALLTMGDVGQAAGSLGMFTLTVVSGLAVYQLLVVPLYFFLLTRTNPYRFLLTLGRPWMVGFATASSAVALPELLHCLEIVNHVDRRITRFVLPLSVTINRDASSLFIATSCIFIAQLTGVDLSATKVVLVWVLTTVMSLAIPSVPSSSVVAVLINLTALNIHAHSIGLLFAMEWFLDRLRTASNVLSHGYCAKATFLLCQSSLPALEPDLDFEQMDDIVIDVLSPAEKACCNGGGVTDTLVNDSKM